MPWFKADSLPVVFRKGKGEVVASSIDAKPSIGSCMSKGLREVTLRICQIPDINGISSAVFGKAWRCADFCTILGTLVSLSFDTEKEMMLVIN
ncbi:MAG: hypothetical protein RLZZ117_20 [Cyanobacteriota bacterium]